MKNRFLVTVFLGFIAAVATNSAFAQTANSVINKYISKQAEEQEAAESVKDRRIIYGDVNGDKKKDAIVQFVLEGFGGGNNWSQRLAVFLDTGKNYKFAGEDVIGGKFFYYTSKLKNVRNNRIYLTTQTCPEPPQGMCENPKKGLAIFAIRNGKLKQLK